ncbi:MAG: TRAP transporter small permease subunit, partial [Solimonas sp.]
LGGAAVYRAKVHVAVEALLNAVSENKRKSMLWVDACMIATALFMLVYGTQLCITTWHQSISDFPGLSVGLTYMPIPIAGVLTLLFIAERIWLGDPPKSDVMYSDQAVDLE